MQPCESRRNCQPETAETDFFHAFGSEEDGDRSGKTEVQGNERVMQLSQQVQHLSEQTERLSQLYSENRR
ncbi:MbeD/MobD family mobilization/exclusion protein [Escherichia coli]|uniref:MbeD/MobD family mobilization/exclusion protein n=1 Tax=Escherichia coli TaxID=562 RepID=UPI003EE33D54